MRTVLLFLVSLIFVLTGCKAQDPVVKEAQTAEQQVKYQKAVEALNSNEFVLEADRITFRNGRFTYVSSNTNFVSMNGDKATIQLAFNSPYAGPNGIGGITVDGRASNVKVKTDKKGNITFSMSVLGTGVSATVTFSLIAGSNQCTATVTPNFSNRIITFSGYLYPESESEVFKGRAL